jgi:RNA polymerase sigma-70 factor (ECF subfamily)
MTTRDAARGRVPARSNVPPIFDNTRALNDSAAQRRRTEQAVRRASQGDMQAFAELYARYSGGIYNYVRSIVGDRHEAEDVTQQVFLKLMTCLHRYDPSRARFVAWMLRVARNVAIDSLREPRPTVVSATVDRPHDDFPATTHRASLRDALDGLTDGQRDVLVLREMVGLSAGEVGARLGKGEAAVHTLHHRARRAARKRLTALDVSPSTRATIAPEQQAA